jgi:hypothetical protein
LHRRWLTAYPGDGWVRRSMEERRRRPVLMT